MPLINVYGEVSPGSELILDITSLKFAPLVMDLLPHGPAWDREDPILGELVKAESLELSRVDVRARALARELDPGQTFELLVDWETSYGLPECAEPDTLEGRRTALQAKLLAQSGHDHSYGWWDSLLIKLGYALHWFFRVLSGPKSGLEDRREKAHSASCEGHGALPAHSRHHFPLDRREGRPRREGAED